MPGAAAVAQKGRSSGAVSKTSINKHRRRIFWERREWMPSSCYLWFLRTYLFSHVLNIISINSPLNYVIWSVRFLPRAQMLWVRARLLSNVRSCVLKKSSETFFYTWNMKANRHDYDAIVSVCVLYAAHGIEQQTMLNPYMRYISEEKCIVGRRLLACRCELVEGEHSFRARCESTIHRRFASLFRIASSVKRP